MYVTEVDVNKNNGYPTDFSRALISLFISLQVVYVVFIMKLKNILHPREIEARFYRFFFVTNYSYFLGVTIHSLFIYLFSYLGNGFMMKYNIISTLVFLVAFVLNRKGWHQFALFLILFEIPVHASLAIHFIGWDSGFSVYLMALIPLICFYPNWSHVLKIVLSILVTVFSLGLKYYSVENVAVMPVADDILNNLYYMNSFFFYVVLVFLSLYYALAANRAQDELQLSYEEINKLARTDTLTSLSNRRDTLERIELEALRCERNKCETAIILADIDDFKKFNDQYGHDCGDYVLVAVADSIEHMLRRDDHVGRWGGEEFIIVLPDTSREKAAQVVELLRQNISSNKFIYKDEEHHVSLTFGISLCKHSMNIGKAINDADRALLKGTRNGKDQVVFSED